MSSLRLGWIAAWGGTAFGAFLAASPVIGETFPLWVAGTSLVIGYVGYWLVGWRRTGFDTGDGEPQLHDGKHRLSLKYELEPGKDGYVFRVKHPRQVRVVGASLVSGELAGEMCSDGWSPNPKGALRTRRTGATLTFYSPRPKERDYLVFNLESDECFGRSEIKFYRRE